MGVQFRAPSTHPWSSDMVGPPPFTYLVRFLEDCKGRNRKVRSFILRYNIHMIITIGGNVGAGKTTLAARLSKALGYKELYMGGLMREIAEERGMPIEEFYTKLKAEPDLEQSLDDRQAKMMREHDNLVVQGRLAWFFAKGSPFQVFNILILVDPEVGAQRSGQRPENSGREIGELLTANADRTRTELKRYHELYGIENFLDERHYDFKFDTTGFTEDEVLDRVLAEIDQLKKLQIKK
jgi:predicted cytidylate kinase